MEFIKIENKKSWFTDIPRLIPYTKEWIDFWTEEKKRCIEGIWKKDFNGYRYMGGNLYFYIHYCTIIDFNDENAVSEKIRPDLRDIEWERNYLLIAARGFSGFKDDEEYTCVKNLKEWQEGHIDKFFVHKSAFKKDGTPKTYVDPWEYCRKLHDKPLGRPMYHNDCQDIMEFGSRGGGKSYFWSLAGLKHSLLFDGQLIYNKSRTQLSENFIGAGHSTKSTETARKLEASLQEMSFSEEMGAFGDPNSKDFIPHPFHKTYSGSLKENGRYEHSYKVKTSSGDWRTHRGSRLLHGVITAENPEASAGQRNNFSLIEEVGLISNATTFHGSHKATQKRKKIFGTTVYIGTAGNMKKIRDARRMFLNPNTYNIISCSHPDNPFNEEMRTAFFLPAYYADSQFKDENGNTDVERAKTYIERKRKKLEGDAKGLMHEIMNYPIKIDEMWITDVTTVFPIEEARQRLEQIAYTELGHGVDLYWKDGKVDYKTNGKGQVPWPYDDKIGAEGTIYIYDHPIKLEVEKIDDRGRTTYVRETPKDAYVISLDPYATDSEKDARNSLAASYVMLNPKYYDQATSDNIIVASYVARPKGGRKVYYQNLEKLIAYYGNPHRGLWFENDRGDSVKDYFDKKNKLHLLAVDQISLNIRGTVTRYGWNMGNNHKKLNRIDVTSDFLREENTILGKKNLNIYRIPDKYLLQEIIQYSVDTKENFDRIVGLIGCVIGIRNIYNEEREHIEKKNTPYLEFFTKRVLRKDEHYQPAFNRKAKARRRF